MAVETPAYDLTVFHIYYGKLSMKIYSKGECVLRIEVMVHNTAELPFRRDVSDFPRVVCWLREVLERFLNPLHCVEACFIADETLERLPEPSVVGSTRVGGVDFNRPRMRLAIQAALALSTSPKGFTASELASEVRRQGGLPENAYSTRQAACDICKLRGKQVVEKRPHSPRYQALREGLRGMAALVLLRDKVIPAAAGSARSSPARPSTRPSNTHRQPLRRAPA